MTATPAAPSTFSQKYGDFIRKAGTKFGFDLASLFEDDNEESSPFEGFVPTFTTQTTAKGRPGTLTYTTPKTQTTVSEFSLTPEGKGATAGTVTQPGGGSTTPTTPPQPPTPPPPKPLEKPIEKAYQGYAGGRNVLQEMPEYGGIGFGMGDLERARAEGYSDQSIKDYLSTFKGMIGEKAAGTLGIAPKTTATIFGPAGAAAQAASKEPRYTATSAPISQYVPVTSSDAASRAVSEGGVGMGTLAALGPAQTRAIIAANPNITVGASLRAALGM